MRTHIKVVGLVNLLYSAIGLLAAAGVLLGGIFGSLATLNPIVLIVGTVTSALIAVVIGAISLFGLLAGFALLGTIGNGLAAAVKDEQQREPALITFLVTVSGLTLWGVGAACWGVVAGVLALAVQRWRRG